TVRFLFPARDQLLSQLDLAFFSTHKMFPHFTLGAAFARHFFEPNRLPGRHAVLLSTRSNHGIHSPVLLNKDKQRLYMELPITLGEFGRYSLGAHFPFDRSGSRRRRLQPARPNEVRLP